MRRALFAALVVCLFGVMAFAQSTTDGAVGGTVYDSTGAVVGGAKIVVHNNGTNAEHTATANSSGYYRVAGLQPGSYTVTISAGTGMAAFKAEQVIVTVGSITEVTPHLKVGGTTETVVVSAEAPQINTVTPEFAPIIDQTQIDNLPINGGRWSNFSLLTPGVVSDSSAFGLLSFRGISTLLNNNTVDGADNNQAFFSEERGRTRAGYSTPKVAIEQFQVNTSNYSSEYGRSAGGVVNSVTKSGTNAIHGEGYFYDRDNDIGAANPFTQIAVQSTPGGPFSLVNFKPTDWRKIAGFGVGGPLIKDKLFWFVAYDWYRHNFPATAVTTNPNTFFAQPTCNPLDTPGNFVFPCTAASSIGTLSANLGVSNAQAVALYNTDLTALNTMLGPVARTGDQNILLPKIDWAINSKNHASFTFNRMRWSSPAGVQTSATVTRGIASFGNDFVKDTWGVAKLDTIITTNFANQLRFSYGRDFEFEFSQPPSPYEASHIVNTSPPLPPYTNPLGLPPTVALTNGFTFGVPNFLQRSFFPDESRMQIADTMTWTHGKHTLKYGFDYSHVNDNSQNLFNGFGSYSYSTLVNYFTDLNAQNKCGTFHNQACYSNFTQGFGLTGLEFSTNDYAIFIQDDWKIHPRLSLSLGLRYELEMLPKTFPNLVNPDIPQTAKLPNDKNNFGPRIGFAWDVTGGSKLVLRGGWGMYYGRAINSTIFNGLINTGVTASQFSFFFTPTTPAAPTFPQILAAPPLASRSAVFLDPHFQDPEIHQFDLTLERDMGWGTVVSASYLGSFGRELPDFVDTNICTGVGISGFGTQNANCTVAPTTVTYKVTNGGPLPGPTYSTSLFTGARPNIKYGAITDVFSGINTRYNALAIQVNHRMNHHIQFNASYTYSRAVDYGQNATTFTATNSLLFPNSVAPEKGPSNFSVPNRFVMNAVINSPWTRTGWAGWFVNGWELAPVYQIQNGLPYTLSVSGNAPGGAISGINGSGGTNRIDILGNNSFRLPITWLVDMRVSKSFAFRERYKVELLADFFNIANKQNVMSVNTSGYNIVSSGSVTTPGGPVACSAASPCLNFNVNNAFVPQFGTVTSINNSNFLYTPRQIQLGARIRF